MADATDQPGIRVFALFGYGAVLPLSDAVVAGIDLALEALRLADDIGDRALRTLARTGSWGLYEGRSWAQRHYAVFADLAGADPELAGRYGRAAVEWADEAENAWARSFNRSGLATNFAHPSDRQ